MFCRNCGRELDAKHKFCPGCGERVVSVNTDEVTGKSKHKKHKFNFIILISFLICLTLVLCIGLAAFYILGQVKTDRIEKTAENMDYQDDENEYGEREIDDDNGMNNTSDMNEESDNGLRLGRKLNSFLSIIYKNGIREYDFKDYDIFSIMAAMCSLAERTSYCDEAGNEYFVVTYDDMNDVLQNYFGLSAPQEQAGDILYRDGKFYFPVWDYGELGLPVIIADSVEQIEGKYKVLFDIVYIWPENFDTGEVNPVEDWDIYYDYNIDQMNNDKFCEYLGHGNAVLEVKGDHMSLLEFHSYEGYAVSLTEDEAYQKVVEYWVSLGKNIPENIEMEGITEYGYCFWGYNMTESHANTHFRIAVDINTGRLYDFTEDRYIDSSL